MQDRQTALLRIDAEPRGDKSQHRLLNIVQPTHILALLLVDGPDARVDEAGMHAVDGDVLVLGNVQETVLQLGEPGLVPELVVLVVLGMI